MLRKLSVLFLALFLASVAFGQFGKKPKAPIERTVNGVVIDAAGEPVPGAVVQLKNMKTLAIRSFITREKGDFVFNSLSMDVDWEFKAQSDGRSSAARTISTFDSHPALNITLQLK
jgi:hypothetical protein